MTQVKTNILIIISSIVFVLLLIMFYRWIEQSNSPAPMTDCIDLPHIRERNRLDVILPYNSLSYYVLHGKTTGFQYEMIRAFAQFLRVDLHIILNNDILLSIDALKSQEVNIVCNEISIDSGRFCEFVSMSFPYGKTHSTLVRNNFSMIDHSSICEHILYIPRLSIFRKDFERYCALQHKKARIFEVPYVGSEYFIDAVATGKIPFTVVDHHLARYYKNLYPNLDISVQIGPERGIAWAVHSCQHALLDTLNRWLQHYITTKEYAYLYHRYFRQPYYRSKTHSSFFSRKNGNISPYDNIFKKYSKKYGWDWRLIAALVYEESRFKTDLLSPAGAFGIMQLMPETAAQFGADTASDVETQIRAGIAHLTNLNKRFMNDIPDSVERIKFVLASYNIGEGHIRDAMALAEKYNRNPKIWENNVEYFLLQKSLPQYYNDPVVKSGYCKGNTTQKFVKNILRRYNNYRNMFPEY